jgi:polygalacturonase
VGDGQTLNTAAFEKAIQVCVAAGGGKVVVPAGSWLTGPIQLQSHIDFHLEQGAMILFTRDHTQYPMMQHATTPPLYGQDLEDLAITGEGIFDGGGDSWRPVKKEKATAAQWKGLIASGGVLNKEETIWWPSREAMDEKNSRDYLRPVLLSLTNCRRIRVEGVTFRNSPKFVFYPSHCTDLVMSHVTIFNEWWAQNGDGIDISACRNVVVYKCTVSAGDDGICMKSSGGPWKGKGSDEPGAAALENVLIAGCTVYHAHGGFVIGSNTDGGVHNIAVSDCNFIGTDVGLRFKSNMGRGGLVDNIYIRDIFMRDIVNEAVLFDTHYEDAPAGSVKDVNKPLPSDKTPEFRDFHISRVYCNGARTAISITGLPQMPVNRIAFDSLVISAGKGLVATQARGIDCTHVKLITTQQPVYQTDNTAEVRVR